jgi:hypothetical protein
MRKNTQRGVNQKEQIREGVQLSGSFPHKDTVIHKITKSGRSGGGAEDFLIGTINRGSGVPPSSYTYSSSEGRDKK